MIDKGALPRRIGYVSRLSCGRLWESLSIALRPVCRRDECQWSNKSNAHFYLRVGTRTGEWHGHSLPWQPPEDACAVGDAGKAAQRCSAEMARTGLRSAAIGRTAINDKRRALQPQGVRGQGHTRAQVANLAAPALSIHDDDPPTTGPFTPSTSLGLSFDQV